MIPESASVVLRPLRPGTDLCACGRQFMSEKCCARGDHLRRQHQPFSTGQPKMSTKLSVTADVAIPRVPRFLRFDNGEQTISIADVTDESLRALGEAWTVALIQQAQEIRRAPRQREGGDNDF